MHRRLTEPGCQRLCRSPLSGGQSQALGSTRQRPACLLVYMEQQPSAQARQLHPNTAQDVREETPEQDGRLNLKGGKEEGEKGRKMRQKKGGKKGRAEENETQVLPIVQPINLGHCGSCPLLQTVLSRPAPDAHACSSEEPVGRWTHMIRTDLHSSIWPTKVYRTVEKNQKGIKRKTRIKKTDELILRRTNRNRPQQTKHLNYHAKSFLYNQQQNGPL